MGYIPSKGKSKYPFGTGKEQWHLMVDNLGPTMNDDDGVFMESYTDSHA